MNKLKLKWVTDVIGEEYKKWKCGDVVIIQSQTGTGKSYFIQNKPIHILEDYEYMLILANRINLKRQLKKDLLINMREEVPKDLSELDSRTTFGNIIIMSYQQIDSLLNADTYNQTKFNIDIYRYIVMDEAHYLLSDSGFNNKTDYSFFELVRGRHSNATKIFISATMEELKPTIEQSVKDIKSSGFGYRQCDLWQYSTGIDYSYVNTKYFKCINDIAYTIKNDDSEDKWLIFVTNKNDGNKIKKILEGNKTTTIITKDTNIKNNKDLEEIITNSKFKSQVLICTKVLDNGINIKDTDVKNVVIMAWDRVTFIQELGRIRQDINNPYEVNLYIQTRSKKSFTTLLHNSYKPKQNILDEFCGTKEGVLININETEQDKIDRYNKFCSKYNRQLEKIPNDIFYLDKTGAWKININGENRLYKDIKFAEYMIDMFSIDYEFAFIYEQLAWIDQEKSFNENNLIVDVEDYEEVNKLKDWLEKHLEQKLFAEEQQELSNLIINELTTIGNDVDYRTKRLKPMTIESILRIQLELPYAVSIPKKESKGENRGKRYIIISKIK